MMTSRAALIRLSLAAALLSAAASCRDATPPPAPAPAPTTTTAPTPAPTTAEPAADPDLARVTVLVARGELDAASSALDAWERTHAATSRSAFLRGMVHHRAKQYGAARPHFERALELDPAHHVVQHFLGWCCYYLGDLAAARTAFTAHVAAVPTEADSHFGLGVIALDEGRLDDARTALQRSLDQIETLRTTAPEAYAAHRRDRAKAYARLGDVEEQDGHLEAALEQYVRAVDTEPALYPVYSALARVYRRLGRDDLAAIAEQKFRELAPSRGRSLPE